MILLLQIDVDYNIVSVINKFNTVYDVINQVINIDRDIGSMLRINGYSFNYDGLRKDNNMIIDLNYNHPNKPFTYSKIFNNYRKFKITNILT